MGPRLSQPKKHHRVPRTYLANFCGSDGRLWIYDTRGDEPRSNIPENEAVETDLYSVIRKDGTRDTQIEEGLAQIEDVGAPVLQKVIGGAMLEDQDRFDMSALLASIHLRSDTMRQQFADFEGRTLALAGKMLVSHDGAWESYVKHQAKRGKTLTDQDRQRQSEFINDPSRYEIHLRKDGLMVPLGTISTVAKLLYRMNWTIMTAPQGEFFVTSDNPAVLFITGPEGKSFYRGGFGSKGAEFTVPLSPTKLLLAHWIDDVAAEHPCDRETVRRLNRMRAAYAEHAIYADRKSDGLWRLAQKEIRDREPEEDDELRVRMVRPSKAKTRRFT